MGTYIAFGSYPQTKTGKDDTPIEWLVLESDGETALLISRYALDCKPYNTEFEKITWEQCTLRGWLNNEFYNRAFSAKEEQYILQSDVSADKTSKYNTNSGNTTKDKVFLLSNVEANEYFKSDDERMCAPTDYARGAATSNTYKVEDRYTCIWWLRSPGCSSSTAKVQFDGSINNGSYCEGYVDSFLNAVRPCVRIRLF